mmetsp:Transcript_118302/g.232253  ORF Transcript_118302/g.232253 Transcript_118302/m.232253 type:complete len:1455 (-) Transcript_118302:1531-5895(-)
MSDPHDMSLANVTANPSLDKHTQEILKKFHWAVKRVNNEQERGDKDSALTQDELIRLVRAWEPQRDIICLYVRWARQLRRNFNLDSIATLLCLSRQCNYTPLNFLRKVKTLSIYKNQKAAFGITFQYDIPNRKDINREKLNKEFLGLSVTLCLLQEQITESPSIMGKTGMRQSHPRTPYPMDINIDESSSTTAKKAHVTVPVVSHPTIEFHKKSSLFHRIWISINHRWLTLYITEHLFREDHQPWSYQNALVFSFQMMAPCGPGRFEFLAPLVGYCLQFPTQESIQSKRSRLREIWNNPTSFLPFGNTCLSQSTVEAKARIIATCFADLRDEVPSTCKYISYHRDSTWSRRWTMLRAYIFHFWLESVSNDSIKSMITRQTSIQSGDKQKRRITSCVATEHQEHATSTSQSLLGQDRSPKKLKQTQKLSFDGLRSITSSRSTCSSRVSPATSTPKVGMSTATAKEHLPCHSEIKDTNSKCLRLASVEEMNRFVQSYLLIHRQDNIDLLSELSPFEVYSANNLHGLRHCRLSGKSPFYPTGNVGPVTLHIRNEADYFIDSSAKSFHIAREQSKCFQEHARHLPTLHEIQMLCQAIESHGYVDSKRSNGQHRLNIGCGGQNWINGAPCSLHGMKFEKDIEKDEKFDAPTLLKSIGKLVEFTWHVTCSLQSEAADHPIAPDTYRKGLYAARLNEYLQMDHDIGFEDVTLVVSSLNPPIHDVSDHKDIMNDNLAGYTRTAAFNMVLIDDQDHSPAIIHFQVLCNFRKVIGQHVTPFRKFLSPVAVHARHYLEKWHRSVQAVFEGKTSTIPSAYNRSAFFLDDILDYSLISISDKGRHKQSISSEYILTEINPSRTLSMSMFINIIVKLQRFIEFDQTIELAFACTFLSNPFWFDWSMSSLLQRLNDPNDSYALGLHPFYDWADITISIFGTWQGGPYNRWSPCGGSKESILETFGAQPDATREARECGERKLSQVVSILYDHIAWINSLSSAVTNPLIDMPLDSIKAKCDKTIMQISKVTSCQFSHFRLGILTTILSGCGLLKEGKHLRNLMYPVQGSASYKHLHSPDADYMSPQRARALGNNETNVPISNDGKGFIPDEHQDLFMQYLSGELGFKVYMRDEIECILCESHPMRSLNCRDWFRKGITLFDCNENGEFFSREYGKDTTWVKLIPPAQYQFAYLGKTPIRYISVDPRLSWYAEDFRHELRSDKSKPVQFKGRKSQTSSNERSFTNNYNTTNETFPHPGMRMADFYMGSRAKFHTLKSIFVLGDGESAVGLGSCNKMEDYTCGKRLYSYLQTLVLSNDESSCLSMAAGCYHMDSESNNDQVTFFPGHLDKPFVHTAWFVPLGYSPFFTIIAVPSIFDTTQDEESLKAFEEWRGRLSGQDAKNVDDFLRLFDVQARQHCRHQCLVRLIFLNTLGSVLSFPANQYYHATITPKKPKSYPRDMFVFHPLDGTSTK